MSFNRINNENINKLKSDYNLIDIQVVRNLEMLVIIIKINSEYLNDSWKKLNSLLSEYAEDFIDNSFERWNIYILYTVTNTVSKELNYKIENNTFFARKIIEDNYSQELNDENIKNLISKHITLTDIKQIPNPKSSEEYSSDSKIYSELIELTSLTDIKRDKILSLLAEEN